jgi:hypothetical protein
MGSVANRQQHPQACQVRRVQNIESWSGTMQAHHWNASSASCTRNLSRRLSIFVVLLQLPIGATKASIRNVWCYALEHRSGVCATGRVHTSEGGVGKTERAIRAKRWRCLAVRQGDPGDGRLKPCSVVESGYHDRAESSPKGIGMLRQPVFAGDSCFPTADLKRTSQAPRSCQINLTAFRHSTNVDL